MKEGFPPYFRRRPRDPECSHAVVATYSADQQADASVLSMNMNGHEPGSKIFIQEALRTVVWQEAD
jgi:hypothetical protein